MIDFLTGISQSLSTQISKLLKEKINQLDIRQTGIELSFKCECGYTIKDDGYECNYDFIDLHCLYCTHCQKLFCKKCDNLEKCECRNLVCKKCKKKCDNCEKKICQNHFPEGTKNLCEDCIKLERQLNEISCKKCQNSNKNKEQDRSPSILDKRDRDLSKKMDKISVRLRRMEKK